MALEALNHHYQHKLPSTGFHAPEPRHGTEARMEYGDMYRPSSMSESDLAAHRQGLIRRFESGQYQPFSRTWNWRSRVMREWSTGSRSLAPIFRSWMPAKMLEEAHTLRRGMVLSHLLLGFCLWGVYVGHDRPFRWSDFGHIRWGNYTGFGPDTTMRNAPRESPRRMGDFVTIFDFKSRARWLQDQEEKAFRSALERTEATAAPWTSFGKADAEAAGMRWDPRIDAEHASARKMLEEVDTAKRVGGVAARDEWLAAYKARIARRAPVPRVWFNLINDWPNVKHPALLLAEEKTSGQAMPVGLVPATDQH